MTSFFMSLVVTTLALPIVYRVLKRRGLHDVPNHRSSHSSPVLRGGGLACLIGCAAVATWATIEGDVHRSAIIPFGMAGFLAMVGFVDDITSMSPLPRLAAQAVTGGLLSLAIDMPGLLPVTAAAMILGVNVVNFMDGINGITSITVIIWASTLWIGATAYSDQVGLVLGPTAVGAALAFLPYNAPRAKMFLGDSGSYLFGALIVVGSIYAIVNGLPPALVIAPMLIYLADVTYTLAVRAKRRQPLMKAHREHVYQRLVDCRFSHLATSMMVASFSIAAIVAAATLQGTGLLLAWSAIAVVYLTLPKISRARMGPQCI